jgi:hypothetical protein
MGAGELTSMLETVIGSAWKAPIEKWSGQERSKQRRTW